jgi:hypothetical protein
MRSTAPDRRIGASSFASTGASGAMRDVINDFAQGADVINLSAIDANTSIAADQSFSFIGAGAFTNTAGQLRFDQIDNASGTDYTIISLDVDGDGVADSQIVLAGLVNLTQTDFFL